VLVRKQREEHVDPPHLREHRQLTNDCLTEADARAGLANDAKVMMIAMGMRNPCSRQSVRTTIPMIGMATIASTPKKSISRAAARGQNGAAISGMAARYDSARTIGSPNCRSASSTVCPCSTRSAMWLRNSMATCSRSRASRGGSCAIT